MTFSGVNCLGSSHNEHVHGLLSAFTCLIEAVLFWQLATLARKDSSGMRPIVALFCLANIGFAAFCWKFFIATPIVLDLLLIAACLGLAFLGPRQRAPNESLARRSNSLFVSVRPYG